MHICCLPIRGSYSQQDVCAMITVGLRKIGKITILIITYKYICIILWWHNYNNTWNVKHLHLTLENRDGAYVINEYL